MLVAIAVFITVVAAVRSTWSPCGLSMLSTLTPLGERSRGHRYPVTVAWFTTGAVAGGATLGCLVALPSAAVGHLDPTPRAVAWTVLVATLVTCAADLRVGGFVLPTRPRQVNEVWLGRYRHWVYGLGFGWQIGAGITTYVMTSAVYLMIVLAALVGDPLIAIVLGASFGLIRGLAVLLGSRLTTPAALRAFHRRFEQLEPWSRLFAATGQVSVLSIAVAALSAPAVGAVVAAAGLGLAARPVAEHVGVRRRFGDEVREHLAELPR
jgi:hypothetical protein